MSKGYDKHQQRRHLLTQFGKDLARRCGSRCELCHRSHKALHAQEVPPLSEEPDINHCIFICEDCRLQMTSTKQRDSHYLRCLNKSIWSETPAVQVAAVHLLKEIAHESWACELLEQLYLDPEVEQWLQKLESLKAS